MRIALLLPILLGLASCDRSGGESAAPRVAVENAVVTLPVLPGRPGAAYFTLEANATAVFIAVASPRASRVELHDEGMRRAAGFRLIAGEPLAFAPGGRHAMLFGLDPTLRPGDRLALTFSFEGAPPVTAGAQVRAPGDVHGAH
jgi:hypothetical protein